MYSLNKNQLEIEDVHFYLRNLSIEEKKTSDYRRLLCLYDMKKYDSTDELV